MRKEVYSGHSRTAGIFGKRLWYGGRENYSVRLLCEECARPTIFEGISALVKVALTIIVVVFLFKSCSFGCNSTNKTINPYKQAAPKNVLLTKADSIEVRNQLSAINDRLAHVLEISEKAKRQCERFMRLYANYNTTDYDLYRVAEVAKETFEQQRDKVMEIIAPDKLPENMKATFSGAMSDVSTYYYSMAEAYKIIMNVTDNGGKVADIKSYNEQVGIAHKLLIKGMLDFAAVEYDMGLKIKKVVHKKQIRKNS